MSLILWSHPYAGYGQKASVALYELGLPFELKLVEARDEAVMAAFRAVSPFAKMPTLVDTAAGRTIHESTIVIEYLDRLAGGGRLIPADPEAALEARLISRPPTRKSRVSMTGAATSSQPIQRCLSSRSAKARNTRPGAAS